MSSPADGTGYALAVAIRKRLRTMPGISVLKTGNDPEAKGQCTVVANGAGDVAAGEGQAAYGMETAIFREGATVRLCITGEGDDDPDALNLLDLFAHVAPAILDGGWRNPDIEFDADAYAVSKDKAAVVAGMTISGEKRRTFDVRTLT